MELLNNPDQYDNRSMCCPSNWMKKVAKLHLGKIGARLTKLTPEQAVYIDVPSEGPFKPDHYRY